MSRPQRPNRSSKWVSQSNSHTGVSRPWAKTDFPRQGGGGQVLQVRGEDATGECLHHFLVGHLRHRVATPLWPRQPIVH